MDTAAKRVAMADTAASLPLNALLDTMHAAAPHKAREDAAALEYILCKRELEMRDAQRVPAAAWDHVSTVDVGPYITVALPSDLSTLDDS